MTIKSKIPPLARQTDQSEKATPTVQLTQLEKWGLSVDCHVKRELLGEHLKETSHGMVLFDPLPFSNILFIFSIEAKYWRSVLNTLSDAIIYKFTPLRGDNHTSPPPPLFQVFFLLSFKTCFFLAYVVYNDKKLECFTPGIKFFLIIWIFVSFPQSRIKQNTYIKSQFHFNTSVFPPLIRPVDLPIHLKRLLTVIIEKKTSL